MSNSQLWLLLQKIGFSRALTEIFQHPLFKMIKTAKILPRGFKTAIEIATLNIFCRTGEGRKGAGSCANNMPLDRTTYVTYSRDMPKLFSFKT